MRTDNKRLLLRRAPFKRYAVYLAAIVEVDLVPFLNGTVGHFDIAGVALAQSLYFRVHVGVGDLLRLRLLDSKSLVFAQSHFGAQRDHYRKGNALVVDFHRLVLQFRTGNGSHFTILIQKLRVIFLRSQIKGVLVEQSLAVSVFQYGFGHVSLAETGHVVLAFILFVSLFVKLLPFGGVCLEGYRKRVYFSFLRVFHCCPPTDYSITRRNEQLYHSRRNIANIFII